MSKTVPFQTIQFSISTQFTSIQPGQSGPGSDGNVGLLHIPQSFSITGISPSDCLVSYPGHSLRGCYRSAEVQSVYSTAQTDWVIIISVLQ